MKYEFFSSKFSSRKWHIAIFLIILSSLLCYFNKINGSEWEMTALVTYIGYIVGNIASASLLGFTIQSKDK